MRVDEHIKYSAIASLLIAPILGIKTLIFFISSIFIDIDHWFDYIWRFKRLSIKEMFDYNNRIFNSREDLKKENFIAINVFHTIEFFLLIYIFSFYYQIFIYIFWGMVFHWFLDFIYVYRHNIMFIRAYSIIEYLIRIQKTSK